MATLGVSSRKRYRLFVRQSEEVLEASGCDEAVALAVQLARRQTNRSSVLFALSGTVADFCRALAACEERVAAVVVRPDESDVKHKAFLREVRELTSAEGAWLIWNEPNAHVDGEDEIPREFHGIRPDVTCWQEEPAL